MDTFNNSCQAFDGEIIHANSTLFEIINSLEVIKLGHLLDNGIFVELCNDIPHKVSEAFSTMDTWTVGQKKGFLRQITQQLGMQTEFAAILSGIDSDFSELNEAALNIRIDRLKTNLDNYIENKRIERAKQHASFMGEQVAKQFQQINEVWIQDDKFKLKTKIEGLYNNIKTWTKLYEEEGHTSAIIEEFLRKFAAHNNGHELDSLLRELPDNMKQFKYEVNALEKVVFMVFENQINNVFHKSYELLSAAEDEGRLNNLFAQIIEVEQIAGKSIEDEFELVDKELKKALVNQLVNIQEQQEAILSNAAQLLQTYSNQTREYSGLEEELNILQQNKKELHKLINELHSDKIADLSRLAWIGEYFNDKESAWSCLGDLEEDSKRRINVAANAVRMLLQHVNEANYISEQLKDALKDNNMVAFSENIVRLVNDIPHEIQATINIIKDSTAIGSSRFF